MPWPNSWATTSSCNTKNDTLARLYRANRPTNRTCQQHKQYYGLPSLDAYIDLFDHHYRHHCHRLVRQPATVEDNGVVACAHFLTHRGHHSLFLLRPKHTQTAYDEPAKHRPTHQAFDVGVCRTERFDAARTVSTADTALR